MLKPSCHLRCCDRRHDLGGREASLWKLVNGQWFSRLAEPLNHQQGGVLFVFWYVLAYGNLPKIILKNRVFR